MKLMTKAIAGKLYKADQAFIAGNYEHSPDEIIVKYFNPCGAATWWITRATPLDALGDPLNGEPNTNLDDARDWHMYGFVNLGDALNAEHGYVMFSELEGYKGRFGLGIERDMSYRGGSLDEVVAEVKGHVETCPGHGSDLIDGRCPDCIFEATPEPY